MENNRIKCAVDTEKVKLVNKDNVDIINYIVSDIKLQPPDCSLFSEEGFEISIHKEVLYQTKFMREMLKSMDCCCGKVELFFPTLPKEDLEVMVNFLYSGKIICRNRSDLCKVVVNLTQFLGFPNCMDLRSITNCYALQERTFEKVDSEKMINVKKEQNFAAPNGNIEHPLTMKSLGEVKNLKILIHSPNAIFKQEMEVDQKFKTVESKLETDLSKDIDLSEDSSKRVSNPSNSAIEQVQGLNSSDNLEASDISLDNQIRQTSNLVAFRTEKDTKDKHTNLLNIEDLSKKCLDGISDAGKNNDRMEESMPETSKVETEELADVPTTFKCLKCKPYPGRTSNFRNFSTKERLEKHVASFHEGKFGSSYKCNYCSTFYSNKSNLDRHQIRNCTKGVTPIEKKVTTSTKLKCSKCKYKSFSTQSELNEHIILVHEGKSKNKFECVQCYKFFSTKANLDRHILENCPPETKSTTTKPCFITFGSRDVLGDLIIEKPNSEMTGQKIETNDYKMDVETESKEVLKDSIIENPKHEMNESISEKSNNEMNYFISEKPNHEISGQEIETIDDKMDVETSESIDSDDHDSDNSDSSIFELSECSKHILKQEERSDSPNDIPYVGTKSELQNILTSREKGGGIKKMKTEVKTEIKDEPFGKFEAREQGGIDFITSKDFDHSYNMPEFPTLNMKRDVKTEVKEEPSRKFEAKEQDEIDFITTGHLRANDPDDADESNSLDDSYDSDDLDSSISSNFSDKQEAELDSPDEIDLSKSTSMDDQMSDASIIDEFDDSMNLEAECFDFLNNYESSFNNMPNIEPIETSNFEFERMPSNPTFLHCNICKSKHTRFLTQTELDEHMARFHVQKTVNGFKVISLSKNSMKGTKEIVFEKHESDYQMKDIQKKTEVEVEIGTLRSEKKKLVLHLKCSECDKTFGKNHILEHHMRVIHKKTQQEIDHFYQSEKRSLEGHVLAVQEGKRLVNIEREERSLYDSLNREKINDKKEDGMPEIAKVSYSCQVCKKTFKQKELANRHVAIVHEKKKLILHLKCSECDKTFSENYLLEHHMSVIHKKTQEEIYHSYQSEKKFPLENVVSVQKGKKLVPLCHVCGKTFKTNFSVNTHVAAVHEKKMFKCSACEKSFKSTQYLQVHFESVHEGKKRFECSLCGRKYAAKHKLEHHIASIHEGIKPHLCPLCGHAFVQANNLKKHIAMVHEGKRPYSCDACDKTYKMKLHLKNHKARAHDEKTPFKCPTCDKAFSVEIDMKKHSFIHTNIRPHECNACDLKFKRRVHLKTHLKTIHGLVK